MKRGKIKKKGIEQSENRSHPLYFAFRLGYTMNNASMQTYNVAH